jgi:uncharacterized SAM-binding protein YcdF (DUF218 family)
MSIGKGPGDRGRSFLPLLALVLALLTVSWVLYVALRVESVGGRDEARPVDALVVLSAGLEQGEPTSAFRARLDHALGLYQAGMAPLVIVAGGKPDPADPYTEAEAGMRYLQDRGVPSEVLLAAGGEDTYASLEEMEALAEQESLGPVLLVSDRSHMFRSLAMAQDLGLRAYGSPTATSPVEDAPTARLHSISREVAAYTAYLVAR